MFRYLCFHFLFWHYAASALHPVVIVPGDGGSQIEARLNKSAYSSEFFCERTTSDFFTLYLNVESLLPLARSCFADNAKLTYDAATHSVRNKDGVETRIPAWGDTHGIEYLSTFRRSETLYFGALVEALVKMGYERNVSLRGAPYDFRMMPYGAADYFDRLTQLIEQSSAANGNSSVVLISHSLGGNLLLSYLNRQTAAWKKQYVKCVISLGAPFGGAMKTILLQTSGDNFGVVIEPRSALRELERSFASIAALLPSTAYWNSTEPIIVVEKSANSSRRQRSALTNVASSFGGDNVVYTSADYERLFADLNLTYVYAMYNDSKQIMDQPAAPGVEWHCLHGINLPTPARLVWTSRMRFPDDYPSVVHEAGDGTVNIRSLRGCLRFRSQQNETVSHVTFDNVDHLHMLRNPDIIDYVQTYLNRINRRTEPVQYDSKLKFEGQQQNAAQTLDDLRNGNGLL